MSWNTLVKANPIKGYKGLEPPKVVDRYETSLPDTRTGVFRGYERIFYDDETMEVRPL